MMPTDLHRHYLCFYLYMKIYLTYRVWFAACPLNSVPSNMQTVCIIQNRNIALTVIRSKFKRIKSSLRLFLKDFTSLELEDNLQCQMKGKPWGLKARHNNRNLHWLLLVKRNKGLMLQIVRFVRSLKESYNLETVLSTPAFNKTSACCKLKGELLVP